MFYDKFKEMCTSSGVSMSYVLDKAELSRGNLARWKSGIEPKFDTLQKISDALGVSVWELLGIEEEMQQMSKATEQIKEAIAPAAKTMDHFNNVKEQTQCQINTVMQPVRNQVNKALQPYREKINVVSSANLEPKSGIFDDIKYFIGNSEEEENYVGENEVEKKGKPADLVVSEQEKELLDLIHKLTPEQKALVRSQIKGILFDQKL